MIPGGAPGFRIVLTWAQALAVVGLTVYWLTLQPILGDVDNFWHVDAVRPYVEPWGGPLAYVYSPAFAQLTAPLTGLPFEAFYRLWTGVSLLCLAWLLTPIGALASLAIPLVHTEVTGGQIHTWLAVMCVIGIRQPAAWSFGLLTKVTPGIGLFWQIGRREWRAAGWSATVTLLVVALSFAINPEAWFTWVGLLLESSTRNMDNLAVSEWPAIFRLPIAVGLVVMAAWRGRAVAVPLIVCFALPAIWPWSLALVAAMPRLAGVSLPMGAWSGLPPQGQVGRNRTSLSSR